MMGTELTSFSRPSDERGGTLSRADARLGDSRIRVLLVDDHTAFRQALALVLAQEPDLQVVAHAGSIATAHQVIEAGVRVDVAIVDLGLPDGHGADLIRELRDTCAGMQALALTAHGDCRDATRAMGAGAAGFLPTSASLEEIVAAVRRLAAGGWLHTPIELVELLREAGAERARELAARAMIRRLTPRERAVLDLLAEGLSDAEMAHRLSVSTETVRTHMVNLLKKLGVESRLQALIVAVRHDLVTLA